MRARVQGNDEARELLEHILHRAEEGYLNFALVLTYEQNQPTCEMAGVGGLDNLVATHLRLIAHKLEIGPLETAKGCPANQWVYDLALQAYSHDFASWLIQAELTRRRENAPAPLKVAFVRWLEGAAESCQVMLNNVMRPMLPRIGAVEGTHRKGRVNYFCDLKPIVSSFATVAGAREDWSQAPLSERIRHASLSR